MYDIIFIEYFDWNSHFHINVSDLIHPIPTLYIPVLFTTKFPPNFMNSLSTHSDHLVLSSMWMTWDHLVDHK